jgi:hypothetical protein
MRLLLFCLAFATSACSKIAATPLTESDWTNGKQPCSENRLSFRDGQIAYYPRASKPLVFAKIESMTQDEDDPNLTTVVAKPASALLKNVETRGADVPSDFRLIFRFHVHNGNRLVLMDGKNSLDEEFRPAPPKSKWMFDLLRCK